MEILNKIRKRYHPLLFLNSFKISREILKKFNFVYKINSKKFGSYYCYFLKNLNLILNEKNYEKKTFEFIKSINKDLINESVFIDIGSNVGLFSFYIEKNYNAKIISFEPDIENLILFYKSQKLRKTNRIFTIPFGASNNFAFRNFLKDEISGSTGSLKHLINDSQKKYALDKFITIPTFKLDILLNYNFEKVNLIKIDIEGGEVDAIVGGIELIKKHLPILIIETSGPNLKKIFNILEKFDYEFKLIDEECSNYCFFNKEKIKNSNY